MWKQFVQDYLSYTRKERTGIFALFAIIVLCIFIPFLYPYSVGEKNFDHHKFDSEIARLKLHQADSAEHKKYTLKSFDRKNYDNNYPKPYDKTSYTKNEAELFYFDPNQASSDEWKRLGLRDKTIETIQKYLSKGGHFYSSKDLGKIWGLHPDDLNRLLPYVRIQQKENSYVKNNSNLPEFPAHISGAKKTFQALDINNADTTDFIALPGIGSKLAQRIINFRNKLGGFYSVEQVGETFGLPDSTFQKIKARLILTTVSIKKININNALLDEMKMHPYIRFTLANAIIQYRNQHGNFSSITELKKIMMITEDAYKKIEPYVTI